ncbi:response regulator [Leptolyngbya iicbica]|uniref:Response regulator n=2 Tax=Cyanophyceae TaxID=3028117 RepID=A0A4V2E1V9_9CYAN|nr:response regulator [Leptolyngbya sp. LK]RZM75477.1 response regulator [Leptolyngbya sp. LK]
MTHLRSILLVEDNPDDEALTLRALRRNNLQNEIIVARSGQEALDTLSQLSVLPCVVLLDLRLPKIPGLEVLRQIRAHDRWHSLPVVLLTSSKEDRDIAEGYALGANSYVCKPVDFQQFTTAVSQLGLYWAVINEPMPP